MNSGQNKPFTQLFQNSETGISEKMQALFDTEAVNKLLDDMPKVPVVTATEAGNRVAEDFRGGMRAMLIASDVEVAFIDAGERYPVDLPTFSWEHEKAQRPDRYQGIVNDPKVALAGAGGGRRAYGKSLAIFMAAIAAQEMLSDDVIVMGPGGRLRDVDLGYDPFPYAEQVDDLSPHPGERHRQLSRKLTSSRSRAGKAARWAS